jgi:hypothetical protein
MSCDVALPILHNDRLIGKVDATPQPSRWSGPTAG